MLKCQHDLTPTDVAVKKKYPIISKAGFDTKLYIP